MSLPEVISYDKDGEALPDGWLVPLYRKLFLAITIILISLLSFGIGRLSVVGDREPVRIEYDPQLTTNNSQPTTKPEIIQVNQTASAINSIGKGNVVVSKNGTRYHFLYCPGAKQIKEENKIEFLTPAAAEAAGYTLAANCTPR